MSTAHSAHSARGLLIPLSQYLSLFLREDGSNYAHYAHPNTAICGLLGAKGPSPGEWSRGITLRPGRSWRGLP